MASILGKLFGSASSVAGAVTAGPASGVTGLVSDVIDHIAMTPEQKAQVQQALQQSQDQLAELQEQYDSQIVAAVNATMQSETKAAWFAGDWRAVWGYLSAFSFFAFVGSILYSVVYAVTKDPTNVGAVGSAVSQMITVMTPVWAVPLAVLGVTAWHTGKAEVEAATVAKNGK
jgi:hypothetical protein